jgi:hypothetical protein
MQELSDKDSLSIRVSLIAATTTKTGLRVRAEIDKGKYPKGIKAPKKEMLALNLQRHDVYGDWNYTIRPRKKRKGRAFLQGASSR